MHFLVILTCVFSLIAILNSHWKLYLSLYLNMIEIIHVVSTRNLGMTAILKVMVSLLLVHALSIFLQPNSFYPILATFILVL